MSSKEQNPWKIAFITAIATSLLMYIVPRVGDSIVPRQKQTINIGHFKDTLRFVDASKKLKPQIIYRGSTVTFDGKRISTKELVNRTNKQYELNQIYQDSLLAYKKLARSLQKELLIKHDSAHLYSNILRIIKRDFNLSYLIEKDKNKNYIITRNNNSKLDSAMVLYRLHGDRLQVNDKNEWYVMNDKEYRRFLRKQ